MPSLKTISGQSAISNRSKDDPLQADDPLENYDSCSLCRNSGSVIKFELIDVNDYLFSLVRKCLPLISDLKFLNKLCEDCIKQLNSFSTFIDKVVSSQSTVAISKHSDHDKMNIKVEPIASCDDEENLTSNGITKPLSPIVGRSLSSHSFTPQKKCEILEIVDIKPFHFDGALQHESYEDENDIQILSPKQLKVEIDPDEFESNELEQIRNYLFISTVFLQDHNYVKSNVKTENDDGDDITKNLPQMNPSLKGCDSCNKIFSSFKKYLIHKMFFHEATKSEAEILSYEKHEKTKLSEDTKYLFNHHKEKI